MRVIIRSSALRYTIREYISVKKNKINSNQNINIILLKLWTSTQEILEKKYKKG